MSGIADAIPSFTATYDMNGDTYRHVGRRRVQQLPQLSCSRPFASGGKWTFLSEPPPVTDEERPRSFYGRLVVALTNCNVRPKCCHCNLAEL